MAGAAADLAFIGGMGFGFTHLVVTAWYLGGSCVPLQALHVYARSIEHGIKAIPIIETHLHGDLR